MTGTSQCLNDEKQYFHDKNQCFYNNGSNFHGVILKNAFPLWIHFVSVMNIVPLGCVKSLDTPTGLRQIFNHVSE